MNILFSASMIISAVGLLGVIYMLYLMVFVPEKLSPRQKIVISGIGIVTIAGGVVGIIVKCLTENPIFEVLSWLPIVLAIAASILWLILNYSIRSLAELEE